MRCGNPATAAWLGSKASGAAAATSYPGHARSCRGAAGDEFVADFTGLGLLLSFEYKQHAVQGKVAIVGSGRSAPICCTSCCDRSGWSCADGGHRPGERWLARAAVGFGASPTRGWDHKPAQPDVRPGVRGVQRLRTGTNRTPRPGSAIDLTPANPANRLANLREHLDANVNMITRGDRLIIPIVYGCSDRGGLYAEIVASVASSQRGTGTRNTTKVHHTTAQTHQAAARAIRNPAEPAIYHAIQHHLDADRNMTFVSSTEAHENEPRLSPCLS